MSIRTILANLNETRNNDAVLASAAMLARELDASITAHYAIPAARMYPEAYYEPIPEMFEAHRRFFDEQAKLVRANFDKIFAATDLHGRLCIDRCESPLIGESVVQYGRACDLVLVSQTDVTPRLGVELDFVPRIAIGVGRPVIVIPLKMPLSRLPERVVIGWNGSREAARALFDSMPLLQRAKTIRLIWIDPPTGCSNRDAPAGTDITETLARHGINALVDVVSTSGESEGDILLRKATDLNAEMLILGAYGRSRLSEFILGGATRTVLRRLKCPVLISH